jgi:hypothetical protein
MSRPEVSAQGRRSPSEAMLLPRGSKPCAVRYVHRLYEGRYFAQTFELVRSAARALRLALHIVLGSFLLTFPATSCSSTLCFRQATGREVKLRPPTRASSCYALLVTVLELRPEGAAAVLMRAYCGGALSRLNHRSNGPVQSDAGGKSMVVRFPPCSSSNSNSSLEGKSATLHFEGTNS